MYQFLYYVHGVYENSSSNCSLNTGTYPLIGVWGLSSSKPSIKNFSNLRLLGGLIITKQAFSASTGMINDPNVWKEDDADG